MNLDPRNQQRLLGFNNLFNHFAKLLDSKMSVVWQQAQNRMFVQQSIILNML